jgi:hypothetical protein
MASDIIDHPVLDALFRYWSAKRGDAPLPARQAIDPVEMGPRLLPHLLLCDLFDRGAGIRFRLVGTNVVARFGFDPTGQHLEEMPEGYFARLAALHHVSFCERAAVYAESSFRWGVNRRLRARHLLLPLTNGGIEPTMSLMGIVFQSDEVFPPQIRTLNAIAVHDEYQCTVLAAPDDAGGDARHGLSVA